MLPFGEQLFLQKTFFVFRKNGLKRNLDEKCIFSEDHHLLFKSLAQEVSLMSIS